MATVSHNHLPGSTLSGRNQPGLGCQMTPIIDAELVEGLKASALRAGRAIMEVFDSDFDVRRKDDYSPVTEADEKAERLILEDLARLAPGVPVVAEESVEAGRVPDISGGQFFLVDPLDGTKEFIGRGTSFTVNIGLIEDRQPRLGVVLAPATGDLYWGIVDEGAWLLRNAYAAQEEAQPLQVRQATPDDLAIVASRSHLNPATEAILAQYPKARQVNIGSSLKFCLVAEGRADLYPRMGPTMEWDTAAGHAVLSAAGGSVTTPDGGEFLYAKPDFRNGHFIAKGDPRLAIPAR